MGGVKGFFKRILGIEHLHSRVDRTESELSFLLEYESRRLLHQIREEDVKGLHWRIDQVARELTERMDAVGRSTQDAVRAEYGTLPRFLFHHPLDYLSCTTPPDFNPLDTVPDEPYPVPGPYDRRFTYPTDPVGYVNRGKHDHDFILAHLDRLGLPQSGARLLDLGCSSGRVLRHFDREHRERGLKLMGVDVHARSIEWIRRYLPNYFEVSTCSIFPHLPFEDQSIDAVYGVDWFTGTKYLWDMWLLELRRLLKPGGLLITAIHSEDAQVDQPSMDTDYVYHGDQADSRVFWKMNVVRNYWSRYLTVIDLLNPSDGFNLSWIICRK